MKSIIELIVLGSLPDSELINGLSKWNCSLFSVEISKVITTLPKPSHISGYLNQIFLDNQLSEIMGSDTKNLRIGLIYCEMESCFYVRRISEKAAVISIYPVLPVLQSNNISVLNFVKRTILEIWTLFVEANNDFTLDAYQIPHIETRGCLFDLNGDIRDIIYNSEQPIICDECNARLSSRQLPVGFLRDLKCELKKIRKKRLEQLEIFIKDHPFISILLSFFFGIIINIISNIFYELIRSGS